MSIYKIDSNLPTTTKIEDLNEMVLEVEGKVDQGKFNRYEVDQLYTDLGLARKYERDVTLGHTVATYGNWTHLIAESGYSIWKYAISDYVHNANNKLYLDDKSLEYRGAAGSEAGTTFSIVYIYDGASAYTDVTTEAGTEGGTEFGLMSSTLQYMYLGSTATFSGLKIELQTQGQNYTNTVQYFNGAWTTLTAATNSYVDDTSNFGTDGTITWVTPSDWIQNAVNGNTRYWVRIVTSTAPVTSAQAYYIIPYNSVPGMLALSALQVTNEEWAWCSYGQAIYVTIRNTGNTNYEGDYYIASSSSSANKQNYFINNHTYQIDYQSSGFSGITVTVVPGVSVGDLVCVTAAYTYDKADADAFASRAVGVLESTDVIRYASGFIEDVNTIGAANIVVGDKLYLSPTAGKITRTMPTGGGQIQQIIGIAVSAESASKVDVIMNIDLNPTVV